MGLLPVGGTGVGQRFPPFCPAATPRDPTGGHPVTGPESGASGPVGSVLFGQRLDQSADGRVVAVPPGFGDGLVVEFAVTGEVPPAGDVAVRVALVGQDDVEAGGFPGRFVGGQRARRSSGGSVPPARLSISWASSRSRSRDTWPRMVGNDPPVRDWRSATRRSRSALS